MLTRDEVERQCMSSYQNHSGKFLLVRVLHGHLDDCNQEFTPSRPVRVRVVENQRESDILEWHEADGVEDTDWCAPYWDVELAEPPFDNETDYVNQCSHLWVHVPHMTIEGDVSDLDDWELDPNQEITPFYKVEGHFSVNEGGCFYVKLDPIGIAILDVTAFGDELYLCRINVPEKHRNKGIGSSLLSTLKNRADNGVFKRIIVEPGGYDPSTQKDRLRFYERHGFVKHEDGYFVFYFKNS